MLTQVGIAITGIVAILLTQQHREDWKKYACLFGMAGQPFWFYSAFVAQQWDILILTIFYTYSWWLGIKNNWLKS